MSYNLLNPEQLTNIINERSYECSGTKEDIISYIVLKDEVEKNKLFLRHMSDLNYIYMFSYPEVIELEKIHRQQMDKLEESIQRRIDTSIRMG